MDVSVSVVDDQAVINAVLRDPWIADRIRHDGREPGFIASPAVTYYAARVDNRIAGVFVAIQISAWEIEVHAALARWVTPHGRCLGHEFLAELWDQPELMRVTAPVLATLPSAANYCRRLAFKDEGVKRTACKIDGNPVDVIYLGLTRDDWLASEARLA